ncbi:extracellular solute-binding protein, partial [Vibrio parahaemolyticus]|nr:extracellular solute-binding protein [Vibrio parahaemolyticus]
MPPQTPAQLLRGLRTLLRADDPAAGDYLQRNAAGLAALLGADFDALERRVRSFAYADALRLCDEGALETIDLSVLKPGPDGATPEDDFLPGALTDCFVATDVWSMVMAYDDSKFPDAKPSTPADFFDTAKFPGKRTLRKGAKFNLEFALMADGVAPADVYDVLATPEGVD